MTKIYSRIYCKANTKGFTLYFFNETKDVKNICFFFTIIVSRVIFAFKISEPIVGKFV